MRKKTTDAAVPRGRPKKADAQRLRHKLCVALDDGQAAFIDLFASQHKLTQAQVFRHIVDNLRQAQAAQSA